VTRYENTDKISLNFLIQYVWSICVGKISLDFLIQIKVKLDKILAEQSSTFNCSVSYAYFEC